MASTRRVWKRFWKLENIYTNDTNMWNFNTTENFSSPFNGTRSSNCPPKADSSEFKIIKTAANSLLFFLSLAGNALIVTVIARNRRMRTVVHCLILNMAISDLLVPVFVIPPRIVEIYIGPLRLLIGGAIGLAFCKLRPFIGDVSSAVSIVSLVVIAFERYHAIAFPTKRSRIGKKLCSALIVGSWLSPAVFYSTNFYTMRTLRFQGKTYCYHSWKPAFNTLKANKIQFTVYFVLFLLLPLAVLVVLYSSTAFVLWSQQYNNLGRVAQARRAKENKQVTLMAFTVVVVFFLTWLPFNIYTFLFYFIWEGSLPCEARSGHIVVDFVAYGYAVINPLVYYTFSENYRRGINQLLLCMGRCQRAQHQNASSIELSTCTQSVGSLRCDDAESRGEFKRLHRGKTDSTRTRGLKQVETP